ncbi:hypothetical protein BU16DRAFT_551428 [Lophium mytilinum]|uniref:C2H2-type domain-containing protein n=1 Tax=Lophium mytilinum TaxID=390894 RepID=A0A6A6QNH1_9PEZI|nr:hypothetical protein BU16DRAFT_551428 [Lophium mytilinum]
MEKKDTEHPESHAMGRRGTISRGNSSTLELGQDSGRQADDRGRESTADTTPISTPIEAACSPHFGRKRGEKDLYFSWHARRKPHELGSGHRTNELQDSDLLFEDAGDCSFPLFPESPPRHTAFDMATAASPIDISTPPRFNSTSPRNPASNLTYALQGASAHDYHDSALNIGGATQESRDGRLSVGGRHDSISNGLGGSYYGSGARPISMKDRPRRESNNGSFMGGMSWGGVSVGSFIRDDIFMGGTSPAFNQSPSYHSSSYLPKMEANFMKDFSCCGLVLDTLHELLQHYEEKHANPSNLRTSQSAQGGLPGSSNANGSSGAAPAVQAQPDSTTQTQHGFRTPTATPASTFRSQRIGSDGFNRTNLSTVQDMDSLEDMEMDDADPLPQIDENPLTGNYQLPHDTPTGNGLPQLNVNVANTVAHSGLRTSTPSTPAAGHQGFGLQHNPTVSSVNTPTLGTMQQQQQNRSSPDSSHPGTPAELLDFDFAGLPMQMGAGMMQGSDNFNFGFQNGISNFDGTIDQPAKRLYSKQGGPNQQQLQMAFNNYQMGNDNGEFAKLRQQQITSGNLNMAPMQFQEEVKPFRCPVIGCEKAYKNQNGLKYHKVHGHQNQQLKENDDGTFSIVDPLTSIPYPGTVGMEKEKPYKCEHCGKRYKNLNGLKYHRGHSNPCNPDLRMNHLAAMGLGPNNLQGPNVNVAGAGFLS